MAIRALGWRNAAGRRAAAEEDGENMWQHDPAGSVATSARPLADSSDSALVRRALRNHPRAFDEIVVRYDAKVRKLVSRVVDESDVDDVAQNAFLSAYRALDSFEETARFSSWLYRIAWNAALMRLRSQRRRREVYLEDLARQDGFDLESREAVVAGPDFEVERREVGAAVGSAIADLPILYQNVVVLRHLKELSTDDAGRALGITAAAVKTRLLRARRGLRTALAAAPAE
jgi:RNA polymerase sigma-70 factor, ECF subfamily